MYTISYIYVAYEKRSDKINYIYFIDFKSNRIEPLQNLLFIPNLPSISHIKTKCNI